MFSKQFFNQAQKEGIQAAIADAELNTSGEIRVHIDDKCAVSPVEKAIEVFEKLKMHETELRNGVLIYVAVKDHKLAIVGDQGINDVVADNFLISNNCKLMVFHSNINQYSITKLRFMHLQFFKNFNCFLNRRNSALIIYMHSNFT
jgi:uncharacterized membrane protein